MGKLLSREEVFAADDIAYETVDVPEWGGSLRVRGLTGAERERYEASVGYVKGDRWVPKGNAAARLVAMSVVDEQGRLVFSEEDITKLGRKSAAALRRIVEVSKRLSGLSDEDMDWLEGNSDGVRSDSSSSSSLSLSGAPTPSSSGPSPVAN